MDYILEILIVLVLIAVGVTYIIGKRKKILFQEKEIRRGNIRQMRSERNKQVLANKKK